ncbi:hypothetical protein BBK36DRAFT_1139816 [Trichoderma citrinoviride]|uniref:Uncharacterized protein n=1 Tax=Trichoderma citrinoviride TaxID=58853 RepID=A0A2T4BG71_9HYPO|nr:hypothetical protein BBK36DRAFT_1139816 [Trichoderma citrinoviride]PTB68326.1 hypothetical protein BBK36DRAFT_1139816 [Trichoderma citrinoviride]
MEAGSFASPSRCVPALRSHSPERVYYSYMHPMFALTRPLSLPVGTPLQPQQQLAACDFEQPQSEEQAATTPPGDELATLIHGSASALQSMRALAIQLSNPNDGSATSHPHRAHDQDRDQGLQVPFQGPRQQAAKWLSDKRSAEETQRRRKDDLTQPALGALKPRG